MRLAYQDRVWSIPVHKRSDLRLAASRRQGVCLAYYEWAELPIRKAGGRAGAVAAVYDRRGGRDEGERRRPQTAAKGLPWLDWASGRRRGGARPFGRWEATVWETRYGSRRSKGPYLGAEHATSLLRTCHIFWRKVPHLLTKGAFQSVGK